MDDEENNDMARRPTATSNIHIQYGITADIQPWKRSALSEYFLVANYFEHVYDEHNITHEINKTNAFATHITNKQGLLQWKYFWHLQSSRKPITVRSE